MRIKILGFAGLTATALILSACQHQLSGESDSSSSNFSGQGTRDSPLSELSVVMPIAAGKTEAWRTALVELLGAKYSEYDASRRRWGVVTQTTFLQKTPMGDFALIHLTGPDVRKSLHAMSESQNPWDISWRELTHDLHGVDFAKGAQVFPKVERLFSMEQGDTTDTQPFMFVAPLTQKGALELRALANDLMGSRNAEYVAARARIGVQRESVFLESTPAGDAVVFYWLASDPKASIKKFMGSTAPFDLWLRTQAQKSHPITLEMLKNTVMENILVADYPGK